MKPITVGNLFPIQTANSLKYKYVIIDQYGIHAVHKSRS